MVDLPVRFIERMKELLGEGYEAFEAMTRNASRGCA